LLWEYPPVVLFVSLSGLCLTCLEWEVASLRVHLPELKVMV
jgi:hypothetical protein